MATRAVKRSAASTTAGVRVRPVQPGDLAQVVDIDAEVTGLRKRAYWKDVLDRYGRPGSAQSFFLVAAEGPTVLGYVVGEVRDWEFGSPPCGWVFGISVRPDARLGGLGAQLLAAILKSFRQAGVKKVRTMLSRDNHLILSFFRSQGMMAGPFIPLELDLE